MEQPIQERTGQKQPTQNQPWHKIAVAKAVGKTSDEKVAEAKSPMVT